MRLLPQPSPCMSDSGRRLSRLAFVGYRRHPLPYVAGRHSNAEPCRVHLPALIMRGNNSALAAEKLCARMRHDSEHSSCYRGRVCDRTRARSINLLERAVMDTQHGA